MSRPIQVLKYGALVWQDPEMDEARKTSCLCLRCVKMRPGTTEHCTIAAEGYAMCKKHNVAYMMTRCPLWEDRGSSRDQPQSSD